MMTKCILILFHLSQSINAGYACLLPLTEKSAACVDDGQIAGTILTDLSQAFDCLIHDLLF